MDTAKSIRTTLLYLFTFHPSSRVHTPATHGAYEFKQLNVTKHWRNFI